jgi:hypothetical protein
LVYGQSKGTIAVEFTELRDANECLGLHDHSSRRTTFSGTQLPNEVRTVHAAAVLSTIISLKNWGT